MNTLKSSEIHPYCVARYKCTICGYIYDEGRGVSGVAPPGTKFEDLPDDFRCPTCGAVKKWFKPV